MFSPIARSYSYTLSRDSTSFSSTPLLHRLLPQHGRAVAVVLAHGPSACLVPVTQAERREHVVVHGLRPLGDAMVVFPLMGRTQPRDASGGNWGDTHRAPPRGGGQRSAPGEGGLRVASQEQAHARPANTERSTGCAHRDVMRDARLLLPPTPPAPSLTRGGGWTTLSQSRPSSRLTLKGYSVRSPCTSAETPCCHRRRRAYAGLQR